MLDVLVKVVLVLDVLVVDDVVTVVEVVPRPEGMGP